ncbi:hypothetical protein BSKO_05588 [Bryopsis sp. KO-2023]|nr:hypothetical protein BSKO_05588 [Bryopsis sp. KO-2023]
MVFEKFLCVVFLAGLVASAAGLSAGDSLSIPNPWKPDIGPKCQVASKRGCNGSQDCCKGQFCFRCPFCDNVFTRPGSCTSFNSKSIPSCAAPPPCEIVCPEKTCSEKSECCPFQTCVKCPSCIGKNSEIKFTGKCVALEKPRLSQSSLCKKPPLPRCEPGGCEKRSDCGFEEFCFRCPRCEGRNGSEFNGPGFCLSVRGPIPGCAAPPPCDDLLLRPTLVAEGNP